VNHSNCGRDVLACRIGLDMREVVADRMVSPSEAIYAAWTMPYTNKEKGGRKPLLSPEC